MDCSPEILDSILYGDFCPWTVYHRPEEFYEDLYGKMWKEKASLEFPYEVNFPRAFNYKTRFYGRLISNQVNTEVPRIIALIQEDPSPDLQSYWLNRALNQCLKSRLLEIGQIIKEKDFALSWLDQERLASERDRDHAANTYIIQALKLAYVQIYLEIQDAFKEQLTEVFEAEDLFIQFLKEPMTQGFIRRVCKPVETASETAEPKRNIKKKASVEAVSLKSFTYKQYYTAPGKLKDSWDCLKKNKLIHPETPWLDFKNIFSGDEVKTPVRWGEFMSDLSYFVKLIHKEHKLIKGLGRGIWEVTCKCFVKPDGTPFEQGKFHDLKRPKINKAAIESAVEQLL